VALEGLGFTVVRDVEPGEAIYIDMDGNFHARQCASNSSLNPCIFEYVYLARPDSTIDGVTVYNVRMRMGDYLAEKIRAETDVSKIDVVMPIPDSSRPAAMQVAKRLGISYREGFFKNRYIGRTFIMRCVRNLYAKSSMQCGLSSKIKRYLLWMTRLCVARPRMRLCKWLESQVPRK
jgi:amidophosphoribosyltransferase